MLNGYNAPVPRYDSDWLREMWEAQRRTTGLAWTAGRGPLDHTLNVHTLRTVHGEELATFRHEADRHWTALAHWRMGPLMEQLQRLQKVAWCARMLLDGIYEFDRADGEVVDRLSELLTALGPEWGFREGQEPRGEGDFFADELLRFWRATHPFDTYGPGSRYEDAVAMAQHLRNFRVLPAPVPEPEYVAPEE